MKAIHMTKYESLKAEYAALEQECEALRQQYNNALNARDQATKQGQAGKYLEAKTQIDEIKLAALGVCSKMDAKRDEANKHYLEGWAERNRELEQGARRLAEKVSEIRAQLVIAENDHAVERERIRPEIEHNAAGRAEADEWHLRGRLSTADFMRRLAE